MINYPVSRTELVEAGYLPPRDPKQTTYIDGRVDVQASKSLTEEQFNYLIENFGSNIKQTFIQCSQDHDYLVKKLEVRLEDSLKQEIFVIISIFAEVKANSFSW